MSPLEASHDFVDHTSEVTIRATAPTFGDLLAEFARAFVELVPEPLFAEGTGDVRSVRVEGADPVGVAVDWLNELVWLAEVELAVPDPEAPMEVTVQGSDEDRGGSATEVAATIRTLPLSAPFVLVKAATLHGAAVRPRAGGFEGEVTLDV